MADKCALKRKLVHKGRIHEHLQHNNNARTKSASRQNAELAYRCVLKFNI